MGRISKKIKEISSFTAKNGTSKEDALDNLLENINGLNSILPLIAQTGYVLKEMYVEVSIPPGINMCFEKTLETPKETIEKILKAHKDKEMLKMIVNALVSAEEYQKKIKLGSLIFTSIIVNISIPPKTSVKYIKK
jgi:hypothetical protein